MIIKPLRPQKARKVALVVASFKTVTIYTVDGTKTAHGPQRCFNLLRDHEGHQLYVSGSLRALLLTTGARAWTADVWRGRPTTMYLYGTKVKVSSLRRTLAGLSDKEQFCALIEVVGWLSDQGVRASSLSSMAWNLWRSTLTDALDLGFDAKVGRAAFYGGRQESSRPHSFTDQVSVDIQSAYPHSMAASPYAGLMREVSTATTLDPQVAGLALASVVVPDDLRHPTLPVRVATDMIQWRWGLIEGTYTWRELAAATSLGCDVTVKRCWAPATTVQPFTNWWAMMLGARTGLSPAAEKLVKALTNLLWGCMAMNSDDAATITWRDEMGEHPESVIKPPRAMPQASTIHLAAETTSRVRTRMLLEGLYGDEASPCHVDTDGIIVSATSLAHRDLGVGPGQWRVKQIMSVVDVRAPQLFRYQCGPDCGAKHSRWHYVASGTPPQFARELFEGKHPGFQIAVNGLDIVLPSGRALDDEQVKRHRSAANQLASIIYGPPLVGEDP